MAARTALCRRLAPVAARTAAVTTQREPPAAGGPAGVLIPVVLLAGLMIALFPTSAPAGHQQSVEVVLQDSDWTVSDLVQVVREAARDVPGSAQDRDLEIIFTASIPDAKGPFVSGLQQGSTVWVRVSGTAMPTRTLLHELSHAVTPGDAHGDRFRAVYLRAIAEVYDEPAALREEQRLAWIYDKCYLDVSCPSPPRHRR